METQSFFTLMKKQRKMINSIWDIQDSNGNVVSSFEDIVEAGKNFFLKLFKVPLGFPIEEILQVISLFPKSILEEMNDSLQEEITDKEITIYPFFIFKKERALAMMGVSRILSRFLQAPQV
jgi:hypothetical protein